MPHLEKKLKSIEEKFSKVKCVLKWMVSVLLQEVQRRGGGRSSLSSISLSSLSFAGCSGERGGRKDSGGEEEQKGEPTSTATVLTLTPSSLFCS